MQKPKSHIHDCTKCTCINLIQLKDVSTFNMLKIGGEVMIRIS